MGNSTRKRKSFSSSASFPVNEMRWPPRGEKRRRRSVSSPPGQGKYDRTAAGQTSLRRTLRSPEKKVRISFSSFFSKNEEEEQKKNTFFRGDNVRRGPRQKSEGGHQFSTLTESFFFLSLSTTLTPVSHSLPRRMMPKSGVKKKKGGRETSWRNCAANHAFPPKKSTRAC